MDATKILQIDEIARVIESIKGRRFHKSYSRQRRLAVFRLTCCCGLRCQEVCDLDKRDVSTSGPRPAVRVRNGKNGKSRTVPLWWDSGTLRDLGMLMRLRPQPGPFITRHSGARYKRNEIAKIFKSAIAVLGEERVRQLSAHCGRHSFITHSLASGRNLVEVRDAAGHGNIATTNLYLHYIERTGLPDVFG